jgi:hypothetical protein
MPVIGSKGKDQNVGIKIAKGWKRDGNFREVSPVKEVPNCPYTNPAKADKTMIGTKACAKKMGDN